ncbi:MAG TPA: PAS domain-containing protein [Candidatus Polarisedimenticolia bacterium]|nr:PAS domain-containing protein [Candidatus Polarisedimenticolia bacterium]
MSQGRSAFSDAASRAVLDSAPEGILVANREARIVLVNAQTEDLFGYGPDELLGVHFEVLLPNYFGRNTSGRSPVTRALRDSGPAG